MKPSRILTALTSTVAAAVLLTGCAGTEKRVNEISLGMSKAQVIQVLGQPKSTRAGAGVEYLVYELKESVDAGSCAAWSWSLVLIPVECMRKKVDYFVQFKQGVATAYGEIGDFDSTQDPEQTINVNKTIKIQE